MQVENDLACSSKSLSKLTKDQLQCLIFLLVEHTNNDDANREPSWWPTSLLYRHPYIGELHSSSKQVRSELIKIIKAFIAYNEEHDWFLEAFRFATRPKDASDHSNGKSLNDTNALSQNNNNVENKITENNSIIPLVASLQIEGVEHQEESITPQVLLPQIQEETIPTEASKRFLPMANKQSKRKKKNIEESINLKLSILKKLLPAVTVNVYDVVKYGCPENKDDFLSTLNLMKSDVLDKLNGKHSRKLRKKTSLVRHCLPIGFDEEYKNKIVQNNYNRNSPRMVSIAPNQVIPISPLRHNNLTRLSFAEPSSAESSSAPTTNVPDLFDNETPFIISDSENDSVIVTTVDPSDSKENKMCNSSDCIQQGRAALYPNLTRRKRKMVYRRRLLAINRIAQSENNLFIQKRISNYFFPSPNREDKFLSRKVNLLKEQCKPCFVKLSPLRDIKQNNPLIQRRNSFSAHCDFLNLISDDEDVTTPKAHPNSSEFKPQEIVEENNDSDIELVLIPECSSSSKTKFPLELGLPNGKELPNSSTSEKNDCFISPCLPSNQTKKNNTKRLSTSLLKIKKSNKLSKRNTAFRNKNLLKAHRKKIENRRLLKIKWPVKRLHILN